MALASVHAFAAGEVLTAANLNALNTNILNNPMTLISPFTASLDAGGFDITALDELAFTDAAAAASAAGRLRRNASVLEWASANNGGFKPGAVSGTPVANACYQESFVKGWVKCDFAGAISDSFNVTSITDDGTGLVTVTWNRDFASANYAVIATAFEATDPNFASVRTQAAGTTQIASYAGATGSLADSDGLFVIACGDQ